MSIEPTIGSETVLELDSICSAEGLSQTQHRESSTDLIRNQNDHVLPKQTGGEQDHVLSKLAQNVYGWALVAIQNQVYNM